MIPPSIAFQPAPDVAVLLNALLDRYERQRSSMLTSVPPAETKQKRRVKINLDDLDLPGYRSQVDPEPRLAANAQLQALEALGLVQLEWLPGERGHLLEAVVLAPGQPGALFRLLGRTPAAERRSSLESLLLGDRFRFEESWLQRSLDSILAQLKEGKSPAPFSLADELFNQDLMIALAAILELAEETPYRVFSVRVFNDSKRFEDLKQAVVRLMRLGRPEWKRFPAVEVLRELNLVANPGHIYLSGPWELVDDAGQVLLLGNFSPCVGISAVQAARLTRAAVHAPAVICIENVTPFYELAGASSSRPPLLPTLASLSLTRLAPALLCLWGNPSPACRRLLLCLAENLPPSIPLLAWNDLDYGGLNILAQLRSAISPRFMPYCMDIETLEAHASCASPLKPADRANLKRLLRRPELRDMQPVIEHMLRRGLKLEQEAIKMV